MGIDFGNIVSGALTGGLLGGSAGALFGGAAGGSGGLGAGGLGLFGTSSGAVPFTTTNAPWAPQQPYFKQAYADAQTAYNRGPYQGQYLADQSPYTQQALQMQAQTAQDPNNLTSQGGRVIGDTISGKYLDPSTNPYFAKSVSDALGLAGATFAGQYGGNAGSNLSNSGYQEALARGLGATATNAYAQNYANERGNQLNAVQLAPTFDYANAGMLADVGASQDARAQAELGAEQQAWNSPWANIQQYLATLNNNYTTQNSQQPYYQNNTATTLGALAGGAALMGGKK